MKTSRCRSCNAEIVWAITENERRIPIDAEPAERPRGLFRLTEALGEVYAIPAGGDPIYLSHFVTCPNSAQHRKAS